VVIGIQEGEFQSIFSGKIKFHPKKHGYQSKKLLLIEAEVN
jgi:hypothetical protein